jgi:hypothetical protein
MFVLETNSVRSWFLYVYSICSVRSVAMFTKREQTLCHHRTSRPANASMKHYKSVSQFDVSYEITTTFFGKQKFVLSVTDVKQ